MPIITLPTTLGVYYRKDPISGLYLIFQMKMDNQVYTLAERAFPYTPFEQVITWLMNPEHHAGAMRDFLGAGRNYGDTLQPFLEDGTAKLATAWFCREPGKGYIPTGATLDNLPEAVANYIRPVMEKQQREGGK